jgi:glyoxylase-like metal-dependent hydrolase (beta-lactamase superfamily II)
MLILLAPTLRFAAACLLLMTAAPAHALDLVPQQVAPGVFAFIGETGPRTYENEGMNANTGFIVTSAGVVVVDSGPSRNVAQAIEASIRRVTDQPIRLVVNTGGQDHRWLGNAFFHAKGIPILAHENTARDIQNRGGDESEAMSEVLKERFEGTSIQQPTRLFKTRERIEMGDTLIEIVFSGGAHTPGDSIVWLPARRVAFSGDIVYVQRVLGVLPMSNIRNWLAAFDVLAGLKPEVVVPGHGKVTTIAEAARDTRDYLRLLRSHMKQAVDKGTDIQDAIRSLDDHSFARLLNFSELRGGNASRAYLEAESE